MGKSVTRAPNDDAINRNAHAESRRLSPRTLLTVLAISSFAPACQAMYAQADGSQTSPGPPPPSAPLPADSDQTNWQPQRTLVSQHSNGKATTAPPAPNSPCDPIAFAKSGAANSAADFAPTKVKSLGDLDGDGQDEVEVDLLSGDRLLIYVLQRQSAPKCFRKVLDGTNVQITAISVATTKTHGWNDLTVDEVMPGIAHGDQMTPDQNMTFVGKYDGQKYVLE